MKNFKRRETRPFRKKNREESFKEFFFHRFPTKNYIIGRSVLSLA